MLHTPDGASAGLGSADDDTNLGATDGAGNDATDVASGAADNKDPQKMPKPSGRDVPPTALEGTAGAYKGIGDETWGRLLRRPVFGGLPTADQAGDEAEMQTVIGHVQGLMDLYKCSPSKALEIHCRALGEPTPPKDGAGIGISMSPTPVLTERPPATAALGRVMRDFHHHIVCMPYSPVYLNVTTAGTMPLGLPTAFFYGAACSIKDAKALGVDHNSVVRDVAAMLAGCINDPARIRIVLRRLTSMLKQVYTVAAVRSFEDYLLGEDGAMHVRSGSESTLHSVVSAAADNRVLAVLEDAVFTMPRLTSIVHAVMNTTTYETESGLKRIKTLLGHLVRTLGPSSEVELLARFRSAATPREGMSVIMFLEAALNAAEHNDIAQSTAMQHVQIELGRANELWAKTGAIMAPPGAIYTKLAEQFPGETLSDVVRKLSGTISGSYEHGMMWPPSQPIASKSGSARTLITEEYDPGSAEDVALVLLGAGGRNEAYNLHKIYPAFFPGVPIPEPAYPDGTLPDKCPVCSKVHGDSLQLFTFERDKKLSKGQKFKHNPWRCREIPGMLDAARREGDPRFEASMCVPLNCAPRDAPKSE